MILKDNFVSKCVYRGFALILYIYMCVCLLTLGKVKLLYFSKLTDIIHRKKIKPYMSPEGLAVLK